MYEDTDKYHHLEAGDVFMVDEEEFVVESLDDETDYPIIRRLAQIEVGKTFMTPMRELAELLFVHGKYAVVEYRGGTLGIWESKKLKEASQ